MVQRSPCTKKKCDLRSRVYACELSNKVDLSAFACVACVRDAVRQTIISLVGTMRVAVFKSKVFCCGTKRMWAWEVHRNLETGYGFSLGVAPPNIVVG